MKKIIGCLMIILCWQGWCIGQQTFASAGIDVSGQSGAMSISVGQFTYNVISDNSNSFLAGVQQPFEIYVTTGLNPIPGALAEVSLFPNPATRKVVLRQSPDKPETLSWHLIDTEGKELAASVSKEPETSISLDKYKQSVFFLIVEDHSGNRKVIKIIKN